VVLASRVVPAAVVSAPVPSAVLLPTISVPALSAVPPEKVLLPRAGGLAAVLDQVAGAADDAAQAQRLGAADGQIRRQRDRVGQGHRGGCIQRGAGRRVRRLCPGRWCCCRRTRCRR
jgi:hypothetical protein